MTTPFAFAPDLAGRRAVVTGGARGIGNAIGRWLAAAGCAVTLVDRGFPDGEASVGQDTFTRVEADMGDADPQGVAEQVLARGPIELIVNNVGIDTQHRFTELDRGDFDRVMAVNLRGPWFFTRRLVDELLGSGRSGSILFISSLHDHVVRLFPHYSASKAAVSMLTRELAHELGPRGIRVNAISPGWILTRPAQPPPDETADWLPLGRVGRPDDLGPLAVTLLSDALAGYVTGANVPVDGGLGLHTWLEH